HHWANRRLFDAAAALGEAVAGRALGAEWSVPTLREMMAHIYGADRMWVRRWQGVSAGGGGPSYGLNVPSRPGLRRRWDELLGEQRRYVASLSEADLGRVFEVKAPDGVVSPRPFGMMLLHVINHATHHRSEIATMLTGLGSPPPDTGINTYYRER